MNSRSTRFDGSAVHSLTEGVVRVELAATTLLAGIRDATCVEGHVEKIIDIERDARAAAHLLYEGLFGKCVLAIERQEIWLIATELLRIISAIRRAARWAALWDATTVDLAAHDLAEGLAAITRGLRELLEHASVRREILVQAEFVYLAGRDLRRRYVDTVCRALADSADRPISTIKLLAFYDHLNQAVGSTVACAESVQRAYLKQA